MAQQLLHQCSTITRNRNDRSVVADYENTVVNSTSLDNLPDFPGRIARFHTYIGKNFDTSEINGEKDIRIYVSFVVEKDGKLTDIQVKRS
jgi:protein TonB